MGAWVWRSDSAAHRRDGGGAHRTTWHVGLAIPVTSMEFRCFVTLPATKPQTVMCWQTHTDLATHKIGGQAFLAPEP